MTHAVLLAAGRGSRLRSHTEDSPKPLTKLAGRTLLDRSLESLAAAGVMEVTVVTGYRSELIERENLGRFGQTIHFAHNPDWASSGIVDSFLAAEPDCLGADVLMVYGDIVYAPRTISDCLARQDGVTIPVNSGWHSLWSARMSDVYSDAESLVLNADDYVLDIGQRVRDPDRVHGQFMGLVHIAVDTIGELVQFYRSRRHDQPWDTTTLLRSWVSAGHRVAATRVDGQWLEVDTAEDLELYERLNQEGRLDPFCRLT